MQATQSLRFFTKRPQTIFQNFEPKGESIFQRKKRTKNRKLEIVC